MRPNHYHAINVFPDRKEELDGLVEDWLVLVDHMEELNKRKRDLQIL